MFRSTKRTTNFYNDRLPAHRVPTFWETLTRGEVLALCALVVVYIAAILFLLPAAANANTRVSLAVPAGKTVSGGVCPDEALSVSVPRNVRAIRSTNGPVRYRNVGTRDAVVKITCDAPSRASRTAGKRVGLYDAARAPHAARLLAPGETWTPRVCSHNGTHRYSDLSAYRANGRPLGGQQWVEDEYGRRDYALAWAGNIKRDPSAYVYFYAYGYDPADDEVPFFLNNTNGYIIAAAWCG